LTPSRLLNERRLFRDLCIHGFDHPKNQNCAITFLENKSGRRLHFYFAVVETLRQVTLFHLARTCFFCEICTECTGLWVDFYSVP
jgi:hypothetical protein